MILIIDNYDSFVYNLARYVSELGYSYLVKRNNAINNEEIAILNPSHIIISPGPCTPNEAGICLELIKYYYQQIPILGVCLGHQAIAQVFGASIIRASKPWHAKSSMITHMQSEIFADLPNPLTVGRYHSLIVSKQNFPAELAISAWSTENEIMALRHHHYPVFGVQFHPESILTENGHQLLNNFLTQTR